MKSLLLLILTIAAMLVAGLFFGPAAGFAVLVGYVLGVLA